ncbi:hypothetical protein [Streptomyces sp. NPDC102282]|uniref:hypothetical protein n=1 Tax=Streptomyces sp. NPDC102282 TaxID=3366154 RepID=UPI0037F3B8CF
MPAPEMAAETFQQLRARIDSAPAAGRSLLIRPRLVVRESTAPAPVPAGSGTPAAVAPPAPAATGGCGRATG